jgi:hypothetical protein
MWWMRGPELDGAAWQASPPHAGQDFVDKVREQWLNWPELI